MTEQPATETRGGKNPDWARVRPGQPLPEHDDGNELPGADVAPLQQPCGHPGCGGD